MLEEFSLVSEVLWKSVVIRDVVCTLPMMVCYDEIEILMEENCVINQATRISFNTSETLWKL
jgi:hypothetical protein